MRPHDINCQNNFISAWYLNDTKICDELIEFHKRNPDKKPGSAGGKIDLSLKDSLDVQLSEDLFAEYFKSLSLVVSNYVNQYPICARFDPFGVIEKVQVQHYQPGGAFYAWHSERVTASSPANKRHLVFMTYLNDVTDAGETEWFHQQVKIQPVTGLTVIWPADWTFLHRGIPSATQEKYIVTGWISYMSQNDFNLKEKL